MNNLPIWFERRGIMTSELRQFQLMLVEMMKDVDVIFKENGIEYFMLGGSVLGSVRHKGFIPWDDDIDIGIKREYFNEAERLLQHKLNEKYVYESPEEQSVPSAPIGRIYLKPKENQKIDDMPTIDVFALDGAPANIFLQKIQVWVGHIYNLCVYGKPSKNQGKFKNGLTHLFLFFFRKKSREIIKKFSLKYITHWSSVKSPYITNLYGYSNRKELMPMSYFVKPKYLVFEDMLFPAPNHPQEYLTKIFGDYMQLPKVEDRIPSHKKLKYIE